MRPFLIASLTAALCLAPVATAQPTLSEAGAWLQEYLRIDTSNPPGQEHRAASFLSFILHRERIEARLLTSPSGRMSLWARLPASRPSGQGALLLTHHMDVVPAGTGWSVDPFGGSVSDGRLWGRGAIDTKGLGIVHLATMIDLKRRAVPLARDLIFLAVADEELGGGQGMAWLWDQHPELFLNVDAVFNEGGAARTTAQGILWWEVEVAQKRPLWLLVKSSGRAGHASAFSPDSAAHQLIAGLARLLEVVHPYRLSPSVRQYFRAIGPLHKNENLRRSFAEIEHNLSPQGPQGFFFPGLHRLLLDTVQVTVLNASSSINVIAAEASARVDARLLPDTDADRFLADLKQALGSDLEVEVLLTTPPSAPSPVDTPVWEAIASGLGPKPVVPAVSSGFTDSRHFRQRGIPAYGVTPFALDAEDATGIHAADERLPLAELEQGMARLLKILETYLRAR